MLSEPGLVLLAILSGFALSEPGLVLLAILGGFVAFAILWIMYVSSLIARLLTGSLAREVPDDG